MNISRDICLDDGAFTTASDEMAALKIRTETLKSKLESMGISKNLLQIPSKCGIIREKKKHKKAEIK